MAYTPRGGARGGDRGGRGGFGGGRGGDRGGRGGFGGRGGGRGSYFYISNAIWILMDQFACANVLIESRWLCKKVVETVEDVEVVVEVEEELPVEDVVPQEAVEVLVPEVVLRPLS